MKIKILIIITVFAYSSLTGQAQELIASGGGYYHDEELDVNWSIGESVTETFESTDNILTQGFHQGSYIITSLKEDDYQDDIVVKTYPNPTSNILNVELIASQNNNGYSLKLFDVRGVLLYNKKILNQKESIELSKYRSNIYFLKIFKGEERIEVFKIVKTN